MTTKSAVKGSTPEERRQAREARRQHNRLAHVAARVQQARNGREVLVAACNAALAAGGRIDDAARRRLAAAISDAVVRADIPANGKAER